MGWSRELLGKTKFECVLKAWVCIVWKLDGEKREGYRLVERQAGEQGKGMSDRAEQE